MRGSCRRARANRTSIYPPTGGGRRGRHPFSIFSNFLTRKAKTPLESSSRNDLRIAHHSMQVSTEARNRPPSPPVRVERLTRRAMQLPTPQQRTAPTKRPQRPSQRLNRRPRSPENPPHQSGVGRLAPPPGCASHPTLASEQTLCTRHAATRQPPRAAATQLARRVRCARLPCARRSARQAARDRSGDAPPSARVLSSTAGSTLAAVCRTAASSRAACSSGNAPAALCAPSVRASPRPLSASRAGRAARR